MKTGKLVDLHKRKIPKQDKHYIIDKHKMVARYPQSWSDVQNNINHYNAKLYHK